MIAVMTSAKCSRDKDGEIHAYKKMPNSHFKQLSVNRPYSISYTVYDKHGIFSPSFIKTAYVTAKAGRFL